MFLIKIIFVVPYFRFKFIFKVHFSNSFVDHETSLHVFLIKAKHIKKRKIYSSWSANVPARCSKIDKTIQLTQPPVCVKKKKTMVLLDTKASIAGTPWGEGVRNILVPRDEASSLARTVAACVWRLINERE